MKSFTTNIEQELSLAKDWLDALIISLPYFADALPAESIIFISSSEQSSESFEWSKSDEIKLDSASLGRLAGFFQQKLLQKSFFKNAGYIKIDNPTKASLLFGLKNILKNSELESLTISPLKDYGHLLFFQFEKGFKDQDSDYIRKLFFYLENSISFQNSKKPKSSIFPEKKSSFLKDLKTSLAHSKDKNFKTGFRDNSLVLDSAQNNILNKLYVELTSELELKELYEVCFAFLRTNFAFKKQLFAFINSSQDFFCTEAVDGSDWRILFNKFDPSLSKFDQSHFSYFLSSTEVSPKFISPEESPFSNKSFFNSEEENILLSPLYFGEKIQGFFLSEVEHNFLDISDSLLKLDFTDNEQKEKFYVELLAEALRIISTRIAVSKKREKDGISDKLKLTSFLSAGFSHNFNNILQGAMGQSSLLELIISKISSSKNIQSSFMEHRDKMLSSTKHISEASTKGANLIQKISNFSNYDSEDLEICTLNEIVLENRYQFDRIKLDENKSKTHFEIDYKLERNLSLIKVNPQEIKIIISEILKNAFESLGKNNDFSKVILSTKEFNLEKKYYNYLLPEVNYICLQVSDRGEGMDYISSAKALEAFYTSKQVDPGSGLGLNGGGLGLTLAYFLASKNNSVLSLESYENQGTEARLFIPSLNYQKSVVRYGN